MLRSWGVHVPIRAVPAHRTADGADAAARLAARCMRARPQRRRARRGRARARRQAVATRGTAGLLPASPFSLQLSPSHTPGNNKKKKPACATPAQRRCRGRRRRWRSRRTPRGRPRPPSWAWRRACSTSGSPRRRCTTRRAARAALATRPGAGLLGGACRAASAGRPRAHYSRSSNQTSGAMPRAMPCFVARAFPDARRSALGTLLGQKPRAAAGGPA